MFGKMEILKFCFFIFDKDKSGQIEEDEMHTLVGKLCAFTLAGGENGYCVSVDGKSFNALTGTSASTPVWGAIIARLNNIRISKGGKPLGFLNPLIYKNPQAFNDITSGVNAAGAGTGFSATKGWDPTTGIGTPNFNALSKLL